MAREDATGITNTDLRTMRNIFTDKSIATPRHCFRWNNGLTRWELNEVAPVDRTLIAYETDAGGWTEV